MFINCKFPLKDKKKKDEKWGGGIYLREERRASNSEEVWQLKQMSKRLKRAPTERKITKKEHRLRAVQS